MYERVMSVELLKKAWMADTMEEREDARVEIMICFEGMLEYIKVLVKGMEASRILMIATMQDEDGMEWLEGGINHLEKLIEETKSGVRLIDGLIDWCQWSWGNLSFPADDYKRSRMSEKWVEEYMSELKGSITEQDYENETEHQYREKTAWQS